MNRSYRLVWSHVRQAFVVADERAKTRTKSGASGALLMALAGALSISAATASASSVCSGASTTINGMVNGNTCELDQSGKSLSVAADGSLGTSGYQQSAVVIGNSSASISNITVNNAGTIQAHDGEALSIVAGSGANVDVDSIVNQKFVIGASSAVAVRTGSGSVNIDTITNLAGAGIAGESSTAIYIDAYEGSVTIGSINNAGMIMGDSGLSVYGNASSNLGSIVNQATGIIDGGEDSALALSGSYVFDSASGNYIPSNLNIGSLDNFGQLKAGSDTEAAVALNRVNLSGILTNHEGALIDGGEGGIYISESVLGGLNNAGTIRTGTQDYHDGIRLYATSINGDLRNSGTILAGGDGLEIYQSAITGKLTNSGTITSTAAYSNAISLFNSQLGGALKNTGSLNTTFKGIAVENSTLQGDLINSGDIRTTGHADMGDADADGLSLYAAQIAGNVVNSGSIDANDDGIGTKELGGSRTTVGMDLINAAGATISAEDDGLDLEDTDITGLIRNQGTIIGRTSNGIEIDNLTARGMLLGGLTQGAEKGVRLRESSLDQGITITGRVEGGEYGLEIDEVSQADLKIGQGASIRGDVLARNAQVDLVRGSTFTQQNAFDIKRFSIDEGATLNMSDGTSSSTDLNNGFTVSQGFSNAGTLSLAANVTGNLHGNYTQAASGTLKIGVASDSSYGKLAVDGTATLASNAKIVVDVSNPSYSFSSQSLQDVLSATTLNSDGTFAVSDNSQLFNFGAVKDGNTVDLTLSKGSSVLDSVISVGNGPATGAAKVLDQAIGDDPEGELAGHFVSLTSEQEVSDAVTQTLPTVAGNTSNAIGNTLSGINRVVQARQAGNSGLSSGDAVADDNLWLKTFGAWADQDSRDGISGFDANTQGLAIGADAALDAHTRLGLAFAYAQTNLNGDSAIAPQSADIDTFQLIGYGSYALASDTELNVQFDGGQNRTSSKRHMPFADASARADYDGYNVHAGLGIGHSLRLNEQLTFIPSARIDYTWIESESYREQGAGALDLDVDSNDAEELLLSVDGKLDYRVTAATVLSANLGAGYDLIDEDSAITSTYAGAPGAAFKTPGMDLEPWLARAGLGLIHTLAGGTEVSLRYDAEARSDFTNQGASVKARWAF